jgi:CubicO group peptidase (beta-lactamase class C family)
MTNDPSVKMQAFDSRANREVRAFLERLVATGKERGLQVAAYLHGKLVIDTWAGTLDPSASRPVDGDTLFPVYSTGKGVVATIIHLLAQRERLQYDDPIARFWPEFAANGKTAITVRHALNHTSGLANLPMNIPSKTFHDWDAICRHLAAAKPDSPPGHEIVYHAVTYGWILGELAHRADGRPFPRIVREEICQPLAARDIYFGIPDDVESRVALIEEPPPEAPPPGDVGAIPTCIIPVGLWMNGPVARRACIPASNGIMNARSLARHYAALLPGGVDGVELLPPQRIKRATEMHVPRNHPDTVTRQALGYVLGNTGDIFGPCTAAFGHQGYGGSRGFADPTRGFAIAFARNRFHNADSPGAIIHEMARALEI